MVNAENSESFRCPRFALWRSLGDTVLSDLVLQVHLCGDACCVLKDGGRSVSVWVSSIKKLLHF